MADNTTINTGSGGDTIATDDIGGVKYQRVKITLGADGVTDGDVSSSNALPISDNGGSLTVDGTIAATQSGTWNVTNVSGTVSLPTGAATLAEQQTQTTSLQLLDDAVATTASAIPSKGFAISGTDGTNARVIKTDSSGELQVDVLTMPTVTVNSHAVTNAGTFAVQVDGSALTALQLIDDPVFSDDAAFTPGTSKVNAVGFIADETASDSVDEGDIGAARMTLDRKQHVVAEQESSSIRVAGVAATPQFAVISGSTSGDNTLITAVVGKKFRVLSLFLVSAGTTTVRFESGAGGTALTGVMSLVANTGFALPYNPAGWFQTTTTNQLLNMELNAAVQVSGSLTYIEV